MNLIFLIHYPHCIFGVKKDVKDYNRFKGNDLYIVGFGLYKIFIDLKMLRLLQHYYRKKKYFTIFGAISALPQVCFLLFSIPQVCFSPFLLKYETYGFANIQERIFYFYFFSHWNHVAEFVMSIISELKNSPLHLIHFCIIIYC